MPIRESLQEAGYLYVKFDSYQRVHVLQDVSTGRLEAWFANKNHCGYGIRWRNTDLEFARGYKENF
jgi:hypothetical protein